MSFTCICTNENNSSELFGWCQPIETRQEGKVSREKFSAIQYTEIIPISPDILFKLSLFQKTIRIHIQLSTSFQIKELNIKITKKVGEIYGRKDTPKWVYDYRKSFTLAFYCFQKCTFNYNAISFKKLFIYILVFMKVKQIQE